MIGPGDIPEAALSALRSGQKIEAIKILREHSGLGLAEAKELIEYVERSGRGHDQAAPTEMHRPSGVDGIEMPVAALVALREGNLVAAIAAFRKQSGLGLVECKQAVEAHLKANEMLKRQFEDAAATRRKPPVGVIVVVLMAVAFAVWFGLRP